MPSLCYFIVASLGEEGPKCPQSKGLEVWFAVIPDGQGEKKGSYDRMEMKDVRMSGSIAPFYLF